MTTTEEDVHHDVHPRRQEVGLALAVGVFVRSRRGLPVLVRDGFRTSCAEMSPEG